MGYRPEVTAVPTSAAGRAGRARTGASGFTLFEVLITLVVLAIAMAVAMPIIGRTSETLQVRVQVAGFSAMLRHAREKAITTRRGHAVVIDPAEHRVRIVVGSDDVRESRALPEHLRVDATPPPALTVRFEPEGTSTGGNFRLSSGAIAYRVTVDSVTGRVRSERE